MILHGDVIDKLKEIESGTVQCVVTSPPYWGLRNYGIDNQLGLESTPEEYVEKMVEVFRQIKRVLKHDGTVWLNLGDSYNSPPAGNKKDRWESGDSKRFKVNKGLAMKSHQKGSQAIDRTKRTSLKPKDLVGIPWRVAFALQADGFWLRQDIIWHKPNPMPESVTDRCTKTHEYIFLLTKSAQYFYDADAIREKTNRDWSSVGGNLKGKGIHKIGNGYKDIGDRTLDNGQYGRNKRSVWTINTQPYKEAHFAVFPEKLPELCIKAGTSEYGECSECGKAWERIVEKERTFESGSGKSGNMPSGKNGPDLQGGGETLDIRRGPVVHITTKGWQPTCSCDADRVPQIVLDPFFGSGTTGYVAQRLGRKWIGIELNEEYIKIAEKRFAQQEMFL